MTIRRIVARKQQLRLAALLLGGIGWLALLVTAARLAYALGAGQ